MLIYGIIAVIVIALIIYFVRNSAFIQKVGGTTYAQKDDPGAQGAYDAKKHVDDAPRLTARELLELSWKFLYDITEKVLYKFSDADRKSVHECGKLLMQYGGKYNHVVDPAIAKTLGKKTDIEAERRKNAPQTRQK
jgi:hypothetical protein